MYNKSLLLLIQKLIYNFKYFFNVFSYNYSCISIKLIKDLYKIYYELQNTCFKVEQYLL